MRSSRPGVGSVDPRPQARDRAHRWFVSHRSTRPTGPYGDANLTTDVRLGLPPLREKWIEARGDTHVLESPTSIYRRGREAMPELDALRFDGRRKPRRAKPGANVSQMHYARRGNVTPEMEFVALREGLDPHSCATKSRAAARSFRANVNHPEIEPMIIGRNFLVKINARILETPRSRRRSKKKSRR